MTLDKNTVKLMINYYRKLITKETKEIKSQKK